MENSGMQDKESVQKSNLGLATLLILDSEIKKIKKIREFTFFVTNETHRLISYKTACVWTRNELGTVDVVGQSGIAKQDNDSPVNQLIKAQVNKIIDNKSSKLISQFQVNELGVDEVGHAQSPGLYLLWCPFVDNDELTGGVIFYRDTAYTEDEIKMLTWLISSYQYVWQVINSNKFNIQWHKLKEKPNLVVFGIVMTVLLLLPVRLSTIGNGIVAPLDPVMINAPLEGVIKSFAVQPGDKVKAGQLLFSFDKTELEATVDVTKKDMQLTESKLRAASNAGLGAPEANADLPVLHAQIEIDKAKLDYTNKLLAKADVVSPTAGVAVFDNKDDWIGQPVHTGQRILIIANPKKVQLKIELPVSNSIQLKVGSEGKFYPHGRFSPLPIKIKILGYNARILPSRVLAYQLVAEFENPEDQPQLGAQGTARLYGYRVPLIYYLLRKPLMILRETFGA